MFGSLVRCKKCHAWRCSRDLFSITFRSLSAFDPAMNHIRIGGQFTLLVLAMNLEDILTISDYAVASGKETPLGSDGSPGNVSRPLSRQAPTFYQYKSRDIAFSDTTYVWNLKAHSHGHASLHQGIRILQSYRDMSRKTVSPLLSIALWSVRLLWIVSVALASV